MILGVLSDTHGNLGLMMQAARLLRETLGARHLIHLGDDWEDKEALEHAGYAVSGVPGLWCPEYSRPSTPKARVEVFDGLKFAYAHTDQDLPPLVSDVELVLTGHTHRSTLGRYQGIPHMNPGHLKQAKDRGRPATVGVARWDDSALYLSIHNMDGAVCMTERHGRTTLQEHDDHDTDATATAL